jgi:hypothetical protein
MSAAEVIAEIEALPATERVKIAKETLRHLTPEGLIVVERVLRRLAHPDVPEEVWEGYEDFEDGRVVDLETALHETPPPRLR